MGTTPEFVSSAKNGAITVDTANTNLDGTGALVELIEGGANGSLIELFRFKAAATTTLGMIRLFYDDGAAKFLWHEVQVPANTPSASVKAWADEYVPTKSIWLPPGHKFHVSTEKSETFKAFSLSQDY